MQTNVTTFPVQSARHALAAKFLTYSAAVWLVVASIGQWLFGIYIFLFYGKTAVEGNFERWNKVLPHGYVAGDWKGNLVVGAHVLLAIIIVFGGPLQLIPAVRQRFPVFHRWLGRLYVVIAFLVSLAGVIMIWTRGGVGDMLQHVSISIQGVYIMVFAFLTFQYAKKRQFALHRAWALRLFMVVNGVWFFRVGLMSWLVINGGPAGFDPETFTGPFLTALSVFTYVVPLSLLVLELYFYAQRKQQSILSFFASGVIVLFTVIMGIGIIGATMGMWLPRL
ncbi:DUF2306 domain-containing protein [Emticicia sp. 17c]|uniref:DUF2306 domain-containing protein n=1 Tax=Emticicia sp. 17c TaxID=3127704 RepID=UPI00301DC322